MWRNGEMMEMMEMVEMGSATICEKKGSEGQRRNGGNGKWGQPPFYDIIMI